VDELRAERRVVTEGNRTIIREPDRTIIRSGTQSIIRHNEVDRFRYGAREVRVERRGDQNVTVVVRPNGDTIVTTVDDDGFLLTPRTAQSALIGVSLYVASLPFWLVGSSR
jgi:OOP family OmpA-OmpF porin